MGKYRTYRNGIYARRYKNYYIVPNSQETKRKYIFTIMDPDLNEIVSGVTDYNDAEWEIDKLTASPKIMNIIRKLYDEDVYKLSGYFVSLMKKREEKGLDDNEEEFFDLVTKVRDRKAGGKPL